VAANFTVVARGGDFSVLGTIDGYTSLSATPKFNDVGAWSLTYPTDSIAAQLLTAGTGIQIFRQDNLSQPIISGPVQGITEAFSDQRGNPQLTFTGPCDNIWLAARLAYPDPTATGTTYTNAYDVRSGDAETVMKAYVDANAGPDALLARRTAGLSIEVNTHRGSQVAYSARFDGLLALLQNLATAGGLGFQLRQPVPGGGLVFSVFVPVDRSGLVRFSSATGSLGSYTFTLTGPTGTTAIVGDQAADTGRSFTPFTNAQAETDWGIRYEVFTDASNTTDTTQIAQSGAQALDSGSPQASVSFTPLDTPQRRFGIDYSLGDTVTVQLGAGSVVDVVRVATIADDAESGVSIIPTVGGSQADSPSSNSAIYSALRSLGIAVGLLQRRH
jgi:hypothetical protein